MHELWGAIVLAATFGVGVTWWFVPAALRASTVLLVAGVVFASFAQELRSKTSNAWPPEVVRRVQTAIAGAINVALLVMWNADVGVGGKQSNVTKVFQGGGDGAEEPIASPMAWIGTLSSSPLPSSGGAKNTMGTKTEEQELGEARTRMLRTSARGAAMMTLQMQRDGASSAGSKLLFMPLVLGTAAIVPIVIASRFYSREGFTSRDDGVVVKESKTPGIALALALATATAGIALVVLAIARGHLVIGWALTLAMLLVGDLPHRTP